MVSRSVKPSKNNSFFLFGARGTGKSTFIEHQFLTGGEVLKLDLLNPDLEEELARSPMALYEKIKAQQKKYEWIFIDEVQKNPRLLDVVHMSIENLKAKFILTGSSARKLRRGGANLLAGRAFLYSMFPLTTQELGEHFHLETVLRWGSLPKLLALTNDDDKRNYLKGYTQIYLKEEIRAEQLVRKVEPFRAFLDVAAQMSGKIINYSSLGHDVGVDHKTVQTYFDILSDTWLGFYLPSFHHSVRKGQRVSPKFYFFDVGIKNYLSGLIESKPKIGNSLFGELFEHFIVNEIFRLNDYHSKDFRLSYLTTKSNAEVDLILSRGRNHFAIEIKSSDQIDPIEVRKLKSLAGDIPNIQKMFLISNHPHRRLIDDVLCLHWTEFLDLFCKDISSP